MCDDLYVYIQNVIYFKQLLKIFYKFMEIGGEATPNWLQVPSPKT